METLTRENAEKIWNQFFLICMKKYLTLDKNELSVAGLMQMLVAGLSLAVDSSIHEPFLITSLISHNITHFSIIVFMCECD